MTIDKTVADLDTGVGKIQNGATLMIGGFGDVGVPYGLIDAVLRTQADDLTVISNNAGSGDRGIAALLTAGRVRKMICSFPRQTDSYAFDDAYRLGRVELELVPQGTLAERIRAAGAGIGAFFTPTSAGTQLAQAKEVRVINGREHVLEQALGADIALIRASAADRWGNLTYRKTARNFGPIMATAAHRTVAEVDLIVPLGSIDPDHVVTPGIYVHSIAVSRTERTDSA